MGIRRRGDYLPPEPNLSGEWAGDLTPGRLFEDLTGEEAMTAADGDVVEALADAYEAGVSTRSASSANGR